MWWSRPGVRQQDVEPAHVDAHISPLNCDAPGFNFNLVERAPDRFFCQQTGFLSIQAASPAARRTTTTPINMVNTARGSRQQRSGVGLTARKTESAWHPSSHSIKILITPEPPARVAPLMKETKSLIALSGGNRIMNAPFHIDRPEVVDPASSTSTQASERGPGWLCITMLAIALFATVAWIGTLGWLMLKAFSLWWRCQSVIVGRLFPYPPRPEGGARIQAFRQTQSCVAPVSKDGAAPMVRDAAHEVCEFV